MKIIVAPLAGAWIETIITALRSIESPSRPSRARGLKPRRLLDPLAPALVAPLAGAWIETKYPYLVPVDLGRAPRGRVD